MTYRIPDEQVGSVRFVRALHPYNIGDVVDGDEFRTWPETNRRAIIDQGFIELMSRGQPAEGVRALDAGELVRVVVPREDGRFDVVEGRKINTQPMDERTADGLADAKPGPTEEAVRTNYRIDDTFLGADGQPARLEFSRASTAIIPTDAEIKEKRRGGRPKGSKNKPKPKEKAPRRPRKARELAAAAE
jgi:hypothetical protein